MTTGRDYIHLWPGPLYKGLTPQAVSFLDRFCRLFHTSSVEEMLTDYHDETPLIRS